MGGRRSLPGQTSYLSKASAGLGNPLHQDRHGHIVSQQSPLFKPYETPNRTDTFSAFLIELLPEFKTVSSGSQVYNFPLSGQPRRLTQNLGITGTEGASCLCSLTSEGCAALRRASQSRGHAPRPGPRGGGRRVPSSEHDESGAQSAAWAPSVTCRISHLCVVFNK